MEGKGKKRKDNQQIEMRSFLGKRFIYGIILTTTPSKILVPSVSALFSLSRTICTTSGSKMNLPFDFQTHTLNIQKKKNMNINPISFVTASSSTAGNENRDSSVARFYHKAAFNLPHNGLRKYPNPSFPLISVQETIALVKEINEAKEKESKTTEKKISNLKNLHFIDSSWHLDPTRDAKKEYQEKRIRDAIFFDIDEISNKTNPLPHMLPSADQFARQMSEKGLSNEDILIIYTQPNCFSAARCWWTFKIFGHEHVYVLQGGIRALEDTVLQSEPSSFYDTLFHIDNNKDEQEKEEEVCNDSTVVLDVQEDTNESSSSLLFPAISSRHKKIQEEDLLVPTRPSKGLVQEEGNTWLLDKYGYQAKLNSKLIKSWIQVSKAVEENSSQSSLSNNNNNKMKVILDARPAERYQGVADEPRPGVRKGHIPTSFNLPFKSVLQSDDVTSFKSKEEIQKVYNEVLNSDEKKISLFDDEENIKVITSCGSGVTACVLLIGLIIGGKQIEQIAVYDGSWSEWGSRMDLPIETKK